LAILKNERENRFFLPSYSLPQNVDFTDSLEELTKSAQDIIIATPSFAVRTTVRNVSRDLKNKNILILTKGFEIETLLRMSEVVEETVGQGAPALPPSRDLPSPRKWLGAHLPQWWFLPMTADFPVISRKTIHGDNFRVYTSNDLIGVELGGP